MQRLGLFKAFKNHIQTSNHEEDQSTNGTTSTGTPSSPTSSITPSSTSQVSVNENNADNGAGFHLDQGSPDIPDPIDGNHIDSSDLARLVAEDGHAPATAWLEKERYRIWRPSEPIPRSSFLPIQGYLHTNSWVFSWGNPIVSDKAALKPTVQQFIAWVQSHDLRLVYCCVDEELEEILGDMGWCTVSCISEDVVDPGHVLELTKYDDPGGHGSMVKDLKKNLRRADRAGVHVQRIERKDWSDELKREIEDAVANWKKHRSGLQLAATSFDPWLDFGNRDYWIARQDGKLVGGLILTPAGGSYVIKNAAQFPDAPKGTSERLIHTVLQDLHERHSEEGGHSRVTFNISAANGLEPTRNISGWKFTWLSKTYKNVAQGAHLLNRHDYRRKFDTTSHPMFVCYPTEDGFGLDGIEKLLKLLRR